MRAHMLLLIVLAVLVASFCAMADANTEVNFCLQAPCANGGGGEHTHPFPPRRKPAGLLPPSPRETCHVQRCLPWAGGGAG